MSHGRRALVVVAFCVLAGTARASEASLVAGMPLRDALRLMEERGVTLIFTTQLVRPDMLVKFVPTAVDPRAILRELVTPHGLDIKEGPGGVMIIVRRASELPASVSIRGVVRASRTGHPIEGVAVRVFERAAAAVTDASGAFAIDGLAPGRYTLEARRRSFVTERLRDVELTEAVTEVTFDLEPTPVLSQEILVRPGVIPPLEQPAGTNLVREQDLTELPRLGDDVFHTLAFLPGATATDVSAEIHVRGARRDETQVVLDGQELYEPYHLKDFDNALSVVGASALGSVNLMTGALPVSYGDRGAGVLDMVTMTPRQHLRVTAGLLGLQIEAGDDFRNGAARWFTLLRRGTSDFLGRTFDVEAPSYSDFFAKIDLQSGAGQIVGARALLSEDELNFTDASEIKQLDTEYLSGYFWLTHQRVTGSRYSTESTLSATQMTRDRRGSESDQERAFDVRDERDANVYALTHSWLIQATDAHLVNTGVDYRQFDASYDYFGSRTFTTPLAKVRPDPGSSVFSLDDHFNTEQIGLYISDRIRPLPSLTVEIGSRVDRHEPLGENVVSPRVSGSWAFHASSVLRFAWGRYSQSQRAYELMVQDGDAQFYRSERPEQWLLAAEHMFAATSRFPVSSVRLEAYRRTVEMPRPRYVNLFDAFDPFPEGQFDRTRIAPERTRSQGAELLLRGRRSERLAWWLNYAWATSRDRILGREVPREIDQTHTLNADVHVALTPRWSLNAAWTYRTGWPSTPIDLDIAAGPGGEPQIVPVLGPLNSERLSAYHRLDVRLAREWETRMGAMGLFIDVRNLYNRRNVAGRDLKVGENGKLDIDPETWPGIVPSIGISWRLW